MTPHLDPTSSDEESSHIPLGSLQLSGTFEASVPASSLEQVYLDVRSHVDFVPHLVEIEILPTMTLSRQPQSRPTMGPPSPRVQQEEQGRRQRPERAHQGFKWREVVRVGDRPPRTMYKTITKLTHDPIFSISISCDFNDPGGNGNSSHKDKSSDTYSVELLPIDNNRCLIVWSFAYLPAGLFNVLRIALLKSFWKGILVDHIQEKMICYSAEAKRRLILAQQTELRHESSPCSSQQLLSAQHDR